MVNPVQRMRTCLTDSTWSWVVVMLTSYANFETFLMVLGSKSKSGL